MSERRGVTFERLARMKAEYADNDDVLDVVHAVEQLAATSLQRQVEDLQQQLAKAVGETEAAKQATREIMAERNTWARQLADMRDERNTAREETEKAREMYSLVSNDRDNLHVEIKELILRWEQAPPNLPTRDLRRVIARWETT